MAEANMEPISGRNVRLKCELIMVKTTDGGDIPVTFQTNSALKIETSNTTKVDKETSTVGLDFSSKAILREWIVTLERDLRESIMRNKVLENELETHRKTNFEAERFQVDGGVSSSIDDLQRKLNESQQQANELKSKLREREAKIEELLIQQASDAKKRHNLKVNLQFMQAAKDDYENYIEKLENEAKELNEKLKHLVVLNSICNDDY